MGEDGEKTGVWTFEESEEKIGKMGRTGGGRLGRSEEKWSGGTRLHVNDMKMFVLLDSHLFSRVVRRSSSPMDFSHSLFSPLQIVRRLCELGFHTFVQSQRNGSNSRTN